jgi:hypothetical protein
MNRQGYIRIHRGLLDWEWYGDESVTVLFLHLLLTVNWKQGNFRGNIVPPGTVVTSLDKLADTFGWSRGKLRRTLAKLKQTGEATTKTANHWTAVTLVNWAKYQNNDQPTGQPTDQQTTNNRPTIGQQPATIEEGKNLRSKEVTTNVVTTRLDFDQFRAKCLSIHMEHKILSDAEAKAFFDYWTEGHPETKPRYASADRFDIAKRMGTWKRNNFPAKPAPLTPSPTAKPWIQ